MYYAQFESPIGSIMLLGRDDALCQLILPEDRRPRPPADTCVHAPERFSTALSQLAAYFEGRPCTFDLPLELRGTALQQQVWQQLRQIPSGQTLSYGELAARLGRPRAVRAIANACGRNPIPIIVPCHRIIGGNGQLTGYVGGLSAKRWLLEHEGALPPD